MMNKGFLGFLVGFVEYFRLVLFDRIFLVMKVFLFVRFNMVSKYLKCG